MKTVIKYVTDAGTEYDTLEKCQAAEVEDSAVRSIMQLLQPVKVDGSNYVQLDRHTVLMYQRLLLKHIFENYSWMKPELYDSACLSENPNQIGGSIIGRYVCDAGRGLLPSAFRRLYCISKTFKEYEQPYYAIHE